MKIIDGKIRILFCCLFTTIFLQGCKKNPLKVNISNITTDVRIERFDNSLFSIDISDLEKEIERIAKTYQPFFDSYNRHIINLGDYRDSTYIRYITQFLTDTVIAELYDSCRHVFSNMEWQEKAINKAFKYFKYYFPNKKIPRILTHISGFNQSIVIDEGIISVSIDKYLGKDSRFYKHLGFYNYMKIRMYPKRIPLDIFLAVGYSDISQGKLNTLIDNMIYEGKVHYFLQAMFPNVSENELLGYTKSQQNWCERNKTDMWRFLVEKKHLFSSEQKIINRYIREGPFTTGFPEGSPAKTGIWIGLQIVKAYVKNTNTQFVELMQENNYEKILRKSVYKP